MFRLLGRLVQPPSKSYQAVASQADNIMCDAMSCKSKCWLNAKTETWRQIRDSLSWADDFDFVSYLLVYTTSINLTWRDKWVLWVLVEVWCSSTTCHHKDQFFISSRVPTCCRWPGQPKSKTRIVFFLWSIISRYDHLCDYVFHHVFSEECIHAFTLAARWIHQRIALGSQQHQRSKEITGDIHWYDLNAQCRMLRSVEHGTSCYPWLKQILIHYYQW